MIGTVGRQTWTVKDFQVEALNVIDETINLMSEC